MQALVRAQAHVKAQRVRMTLEGRDGLGLLDILQADPVKQAEVIGCLNCEHEMYLMERTCLTLS